MAAGPEDWTVCAGQGVNNSCGKRPDQFALDRCIIDDTDRMPRLQCGIAAILRGPGGPASASCVMCLSCHPPLMLTQQNDRNAGDVEKRLLLRLERNESSSFLALVSFTVPVFDDEVSFEKIWPICLAEPRCRSDFDGVPSSYGQVKQRQMPQVV